MSIFGNVFTPEELREIELESARAEQQRERDEDAQWDDYCLEQDEKRWRAERAQMLADGKMLTYEQALALSKKYYNHGGDLFVECVGPEDYEPCTLEEMLDSYDLERERWNQAQWDDSTKIFDLGVKP